MRVHRGRQRPWRDRVLEEREAAARVLAAKQVAVAEAGEVRRVPDVSISLNSMFNRPVAMLRFR